jgi:hypothetical protein
MTAGGQQVLNHRLYALCTMTAALAANCLYSMQQARPEVSSRAMVFGQ